jgi:hypothetical protein
MQKSTGSDQGAVAGSADFAVRKARNGAAIRGIINERKGLWVLKKSVIGMYSWLRLSLPSSLPTHLS